MRLQEQPTKKHTEARPSPILTNKYLVIAHQAIPENNPEGFWSYKKNAWDWNNKSRKMIWWLTSQEARRPKVLHIWCLHANHFVQSFWMFGNRPLWTNESGFHQDKTNETNFPPPNCHSCCQAYVSGKNSRRSYGYCDIRCTLKEQSLRKCENAFWFSTVPWYHMPKEAIIIQSVTTLLVTNFWEQL